MISKKIHRENPFRLAFHEIFASPKNYCAYDICYNVDLSNIYNCSLGPTKSALFTLN